MPAAPYQRVLLKLSGETLADAAGQGIDFERARDLVGPLREARALGIEIALVLGGGNLMRGRAARRAGVAAVQADRIGMLATVMNALALGALLEAEGVSATVLAATPLPGLAEAWSIERARAVLADGGIVIAAGGLGLPFFTTDTTAAQRAVELEADLLLKATTVDGVYSADPRQAPDAERFPRLDYDEVLARDLRVMDATAFALCREHSLPVRIFNFTQAGALMRILHGEDLGSLVSKEDRNDR